MANFFQNVQTYQKSGLALLQNLYGIISNTNSKFKDFDKLTANLGDTVTFDLPPRFQQINSLDILGGGGFLPAIQRVQSLAVTEQIAVPYSITAQQLIFNAEQYLDVFGRSAIAEIGSQIEQNVALDIVTSTYRFFGTPTTPVTTYGQLSQALALFRNYGAANHDVKCVLPDVAVPAIAASGLQEFAMNRNNDIAENWMVGNYDNCKFLRSNLLPTHIAGSVGKNQTELTVVSIDPTGTILTVSGAAATDANAIKAYDKLQFEDSVSGFADLRYLTFIGYTPSSNPVQITSISNAASDGTGQVVITIFPALNSTAGDPNQNINTPIVAGMKLKALNSFKAGVIWAGNSWFLGMPVLPSTEPYPSHSEHDPETGISIRNYYGYQPFANNYGYVHDAIWGSSLVPEYAMALIFPI